MFFLNAYFKKIKEFHLLNIYATSITYTPFVS